MYLNLRCIKVIQLHYFGYERSTIRSCYDNYMILFSKYNGFIDYPILLIVPVPGGTNTNQKSSVSNSQGWFFERIHVDSARGLCSIGHSYPIFAWQKNESPKKRHILNVSF